MFVFPRCEVVVPDASLFALLLLFSWYILYQVSLNTWYTIRKDISHSMEENNESFSASI